MSPREKAKSIETGGKFGENYARIIDPALLACEKYERQLFL